MGKRNTPGVATSGFALGTQFHGSAGWRDQFIRGRVEDAVISAEENALHLLSRLDKACESEIEKMLMAAFYNVCEPQVANDFRLMWAYGLDFRQAADLAITDLRFLDACQNGSVAIVPQLKVEPYRLDFALIGAALRASSLALIAVECDGHDYHERTKAQAARDRQRDRFLMAAGWSVLRFTGSEIYADPENCGAELVRYVVGRLGALSCLRSGGAS